MENEEKIARLEEYIAQLRKYSVEHSEELRTSINRGSAFAKREAIETGCYVTLTISPPPIVGGLIMRGVDPFSTIFNAPYGGSGISIVIDMLDKTIGVLKDPPSEKPKIERAELIVEPILKGYVFIAMPMAGNNPQYDDVHDAIKDAAKSCGLNAERLDEPQNNERITDRILESIRKAEFVVADLTDSRPNVFYEAGYAFGLGKTPIYIAKAGTKLEFDLKDYPVIFFNSMRELKQGLIARLKGIAAI